MSAAATPSPTCVLLTCAPPLQLAGSAEDLQRALRHRLVRLLRPLWDQYQGRLTAEQGWSLLLWFGDEERAGNFAGAAVGRLRTLAAAVTDPGQRQRLVALLFPAGGGTADVQAQAALLKPTLTEWGGETTVLAVESLLPALKRIGIASDRPIPVKGDFAAGPTAGGGGLRLFPLKFAATGGAAPPTQQIFTPPTGGEESDADFEPPPEVTDPQAQRRFREEHFTPAADTEGAEVGASEPLLGPRRKLAVADEGPLELAELLPPAPVKTRSSEESGPRVGGRREQAAPPLSQLLLVAGAAALVIGGAIFFLTRPDAPEPMPTVVQPTPAKKAAPAAPTAPRPLPYGELLVTIEPAAALVYLDGQPRGRGSRVRLEKVSFDNHTLEVRGEGYAPFYQMFNLDEPRLEIEVMLEPLGRFP